MASSDQAAHVGASTLDAATHNDVVQYHPRSEQGDPDEWFTPCYRQYRESVRWDERGNRFLVSIFDGGIGAVPFTPGQIAHEQVLVPHGPRPRLSNLGFWIDYPRNRVLAIASDKHTHALSTLVAYDYTTWETLFVVELQSGIDTPSLADDLTVDPEGNIYVTDTLNDKIWKVKSDGSELSVFCEDIAFRLTGLARAYRSVNLNGIAYHSKGFLLVSHLSASAIFKISLDGKTVKRVGGLADQLLGDGLALLDDNRMVMAGLESGTHILATTDDWETAKQTHYCPPLSANTVPTSVCIKDGRPFVGFINLALGTHNVIAEPVFVEVA